MDGMGFLFTTPNSLNHAICQACDFQFHQVEKQLIAWLQLATVSQSVMNQLGCA